MDVQPRNPQKLCDARMAIWTKISEECFQHLVESMSQRIKAVLKAKWGPTHLYIYIYIYIYTCTHTQHTVYTVTPKDT